MYTKTLQRLIFVTVSTLWIVTGCSPAHSDDPKSGLESTAVVFAKDFRIRNESDELGSRDIDTFPPASLSRDDLEAIDEACRRANLPPDWHRSIPLENSSSHVIYVPFRTVIMSQGESIVMVYDPSRRTITRAFVSVH
jgi:hypothetical protein